MWCVPSHGQIRPLILINYAKAFNSGAERLGQDTRYPTAGAVKYINFGPEILNVVGTMCVCSLEDCRVCILSVPEAATQRRLGQTLGHRKRGFMLDKRGLGMLE